MGVNHGTSDEKLSVGHRYSYAGKAVCLRGTLFHPGELVAKVGYFGVKSAKVCRAQMGTKPAKVGRLGPRCAKVRRSPQPAPKGASAKRSLRSTPRAKLLKSAPRADQIC
jgi:hypothetical protein